MKRIIFTLIIFIIIPLGYAQVNEESDRQFYKQGNWEIGFSLNIGYVQTIGEPDYYSDNTADWIYLNLGVSTGFYIINGLSIEPELDINSYSGGISVSILGNLCYTFYLPQNNIYPYVKLGYGLSSEISKNFSDSNDLFGSLDYNTINLSAGVKIMYFPGMTFKTEINYRNLSGSNTFYQGTPDSYTTETTTSIISVLLGISILL